MNTDIIGKGIYTIPEVAHLVGLSPQKVRRWIKGYSSRSKAGQKKNIPPLIQSMIPEIEKKTVVSFIELVELRFVKEFLTLGVSLRIIRRAAKEASEILEETHPFAHRRFMTDGKRIFLEYAHSNGHRPLIELGISQFVMEEIIKVYLHEVDFDDLTGAALRWWPMGRENPIIIDPRVAFGSPVIESTRISAKTIYKDYLAEQSIDRIAFWYDIGHLKVKAAIDFMEGVLPS